MAKSLAHIRSTGTFPVSHNSDLSLRSDHGVIADVVPPLAPPSPEAEKSREDVEARGPLTPPLSQPDVDSKEDRNTVGHVPVSAAKIAALKARVQAWLAPGQPGAAFAAGRAGPRVCFLDGFLLYCPQMRAVWDAIDVKLFLLVSRARATQRRGARDGYITLEGFWKDPPGYVDKVVWPNYVEAHAALFEGGDADGTPDRAAFAERGIRAILDKGALDVDMETTLEWAVEQVMEQLPGFS
jgi:nicotinamide/nicotinate riboside kinase